MNPLTISVAQVHINDMQKAACRYRLQKEARTRRTSSGQAAHVPGTSGG